jgi:hypothetical protein
MVLLVMILSEMVRSAADRKRPVFEPQYPAHTFDRTARQRTRETGRSGSLMHDFPMFDANSQNSNRRLSVFPPKRMPHPPPPVLLVVTFPYVNSAGAEKLEWRAHTTA